MVRRWLRQFGGWLVWTFPEHDLHLKVRVGLAPSGEKLRLNIVNDATGRRIVFCDLPGVEVDKLAGLLRLNRSLLPDAPKAEPPEGKSE